MYVVVMVTLLKFVKISMMYVVVMVTLLKFVKISMDVCCCHGDAV